jgi:hypothetical protein
MEEIVKYDNIDYKNTKVVYSYIKFTFDNDKKQYDHILENLKTEYKEKYNLIDALIKNIDVHTSDDKNIMYDIIDKFKIEHYFNNNLDSYVTDYDNLTEYLLNNANHIGYDLFCSILSKSSIDLIKKYKSKLRNILNVSNWDLDYVIFVLLPYDRYVCALNIFSNIKILLFISVKLCDLKKIYITLKHIKQTNYTLKINTEDYDDFHQLVSYGYDVFNENFVISNNTLHLQINYLKSHLTLIKDYVEKTLKDILIPELVDIIKSFVNI